MTAVMFIFTVTLIALNVADYVTTLKGINSGKANEANGIAAWLFKLLPQSLWWVPKAVVFGILIAIAWYSYLNGMGLAAAVVLALSNVVLGYVVYSNYKIVSAGGA